MIDETEKIQMRLKLFPFSLQLIMNAPASKRKHLYKCSVSELYNDHAQFHLALMNVCIHTTQQPD